MNAIERAARIRELNDALRVHARGGQIAFAGGLSGTGDETHATRMNVWKAVSEAKVETGDGDDAYSEHDFGTVEVDG
ncbi:hypothetical protein HGG76_27420 [Ochrobactrum tritici]|uniref:Uncharacterized protein n=1 Tax=Brucella tritici TaxID=94626 RepID=A0A7X6FT15_9HYPH|nr:hypothetical protein [Brucella tritici]